MEHQDKLEIRISKSETMFKISNYQNSKRCLFGLSPLKRQFWTFEFVKFGFVSTVRRPSENFGFSASFFQRTIILKFDTASGLDAFIKRMLYIFHFRYQVSHIEQFVGGTSACHHELDFRVFAVDNVPDIFKSCKVF